MKALDLANTSDVENMTKEELTNHINWMESRMRRCLHNDHFHDADYWETLIHIAKKELERKTK